MGLLRSLYALGDKVADLVPVDTVINAMCAAAADVASPARQVADLDSALALASSVGVGTASPSSLRRRSRPRPVRVFNVTSGASNPLTWGQVVGWSKEWVRRHPLENAVFYPDGSARSSRVEDRVARLFVHWLPAVAADAAAEVHRMVKAAIDTHQHDSSRHRTISLRRVCAKMQRATDTLEFFTTNDWRWGDCETRSLLSSVLSGPDAQDFGFSLHDLDWHSFFGLYVLGARRFVMGQSPDTLPESRRRMERIRRAHIAVTR